MRYLYIFKNMNYSHHIVPQKLEVLGDQVAQAAQGVPKTSLKSVVLYIV